MSDAVSSNQRFRLKPVPIIVAAVLGLGLPYAAAILSVLCIKLYHLGIVPGDNVNWLYLHHAFQLLLALVIIAVLKFWLMPADYGLHWPRGKTYILPAILWASLFAIVMALVDYAPNLIAHTKPDAGFPLTPANVWGWMFFEGVYVGPTEEIPFRALLVTYLATAMPGKLRVRLLSGTYEMNWAGIIVALIFALAHAASFFTRQWEEAVLQQIYALVLGVLYAYWLEKSKSVVAPMIAHNVSDGLEYVILFVWLGAFHI